MTLGLLLIVIGSLMVQFGIYHWPISKQKNNNPEIIDVEWEEVDCSYVPLLTGKYEKR